MKNSITLFLILAVFNGLAFSQTLYNLDNYIVETQNASPKKALLKTQSQTSTATATETLSAEEVQIIQELTSTIEAVIYQYGEVVNIAKERNVPCVKADADVPTFLQFTRSESDKRAMLADCQDVQLIRFSFYTQIDMEEAKSIDFSILKQFPQLKYIVFYVDPSIDLQREQIESKLKALAEGRIETETIKLIYRIPRGG